MDSIVILVGIGASAFVYFLTNLFQTWNKNEETDKFDFYGPSGALLDSKIDSMQEQHSQQMQIMWLFIIVLLFIVLLALIPLYFFEEFFNNKFLQWSMRMQMLRDVQNQENVRFRESKVQETEYGSTDRHCNARSQGNGYDRREAELDDADQLNLATGWSLLESSRFQKDAKASTRRSNIQETNYQRKGQRNPRSQEDDLNEQDQLNLLDDLALINLFDEQDQINFAIGLSLLDDDILQEELRVGMPRRHVQDLVCRRGNTKNASQQHDRNKDSNVEVDDLLELAIELSLSENNIPQEEPKAGKQRSNTRDSEFKSRRNPNGRRQSTEEKDRVQTTSYQPLSKRSETRSGKVKDQTVNGKSQLTSTSPTLRKKRSPTEIHPQGEPRETFAEYFESVLTRDHYK